MSEKLAYVAVYEDRTASTGECAGWYVGLAKENEAGYHQLRPGYGPYPNEKACRASAEQWNAKLGLSPREAIEIVASTIRAQHAEGR